jgi:RNA polymerase-binding transcription factor DksA
MNHEQLIRHCEEQLSLIKQFLSIALDPLPDDEAANALLVKIPLPYRSLLESASHASLVIQRKRVDAALDRIIHDAFGYCCLCGDDIGEARLRCDPPTPFCIDCLEERTEQKSRLFG